MLTLDEIDSLILDAAYRARCARAALAHQIWLWPFTSRKKLMALSDDVNGVTSSLSQLATEFPPAISSALSSSFAAGAASAPSSDPSLSSAVSNLVVQTGTTVGALQSALSQTA